MRYVIACGDEGVQLNEGTRLGFVGAGYELDGFHEAVAALKKTFPGHEFAVVSNEENPWIKQKADLANWEQVNATMQQQVEALADREGLLYSGYLPFADPKNLKNEVRGHMVRPKLIHVANKIWITLGGGEQTYHLGHFVVSGDWVAQAKPELVKKVLGAQVDFYRALTGQELPIDFETKGELGEEVALKNKAVIEKIGL